MYQHHHLKIYNRTVPLLLSCTAYTKTPFISPSSQQTSKSLTLFSPIFLCGLRTHGAECKMQHTHTFLATCPGVFWLSWSKFCFSRDNHMACFIEGRKWWVEVNISFARVQRTQIQGFISIKSKIFRTCTLRNLQQLSHEYYYGHIWCCR